MHNNINMPNLTNYFGNIVFLILLVLFIWRVVESGAKLFSYKTVTSVSKQYSKLRWHPSLSICMGLKNTTWMSLLNDIDGNLLRFKDDVLIDLAHYNGSNGR